MTRFWAYTRLRRPGLHAWREGTALTVDLPPTLATGEPGWVLFEHDFEPDLFEKVRFMLFEFDEDGSRGEFEDDAHQRELPTAADGALPEAVWFTEGTGRVLLSDPRAGDVGSLRVRLISQRRFRPGRMYLWDAASGAEGRRVDQAGEDAHGPWFDVELVDRERSFFNFKFIGRDEHGRFTRFEDEPANRLWTSDDGGEVWTHSGTAGLTRALPERKTLQVHYGQEFEGEARMHLWAENGDYAVDVREAEAGNGWSTYRTEVYTNLPYGVHFWNVDGEDPRWEHAEAKRRHVVIDADADLWTLEGDRALFDAEPQRTCRVELKVAVRARAFPADRPLFAHVWVNRARGPMETGIPVQSDGRVTFATYPGIVTSVKFHDGQDEWESLSRHPLPHDGGEGLPVRRYVVLNRPPLLESAPPSDLYRDPPFVIRRPGVCEEDGFLRFALHAPDSSRVRLVGEWTGWQSNPVEMSITHDGAYWWTEISRTELLAALGAGAGYHGAKYQFVLDDLSDENRLQDPAANWVEHTGVHAASRLAQSDRFVWHDQDWSRPGPEYLIVYQLHAGRFSNRFQDQPPLLRVAREIDEQAGYLRDLGITAILLLPVNEVHSDNSWGYDPTYFYAIENAYCGAAGPDALKQLVDTCHRHGLAVLLDVVFNHAGNEHNILWRMARDSFFDGDTDWGAMINFDHPQCRHYFEQNLVHLAREYHVDGFRLDHTATIVHSAAWDRWSGHVRQLGSGGGWDFLHGLRRALRTQVGDRCLLMAEHLPNEWSVTNHGGPMDSQWCDDFHDRVVDACRRRFHVMPSLAAALALGHTACDEWYDVTNYPESHDEVGNVPDRIAHVAGYGQGLRMSKVAATVTLLSRGIPMFFMGAESGEHRQFAFGSSETLDLDAYLGHADLSRVRAWWSELCRLHRSPGIQGPSPLKVHFAETQMLAFSRGERSDFFVLVNFGGWSGHRSLAALDLPDGLYRELFNSTWPAFAITGEQEDEHANGGRGARLHRGRELHVPDYGAVILERAD